MNIAKYRKAVKMSGEKLAELAGEGLTRSIIANLENGRKRDVTVSQLIAISYVLGVNPGSLVFDLFDPYGETPLIATEIQDVTTQNWLAYDWFGGVITPNELVVLVDGMQIGAPAEGGSNWTVHYLLTRRAKLLYSLERQQKKLKQMTANGRNHNALGEVRSSPEWNETKALERDSMAELYDIDGQLRQYGVKIDKPIIHPGLPF